MRLLTTLENEQEAKTLGDALYANGIATTVNPTRDGAHAVWVQDEDKLDEANAFLSNFDPGRSQFSEMAKQARATRRKEAKEVRRVQAKADRLRADVEAQRSNSVGTATMVLIAASAIIFGAMQLGRQPEILEWFAFVPRSRLERVILLNEGPLSVWRTQPWRLLTPIFIHFGFMHILFNMWWLKDLGTLVERAFSSRYLVAFVVVSGILSNGLQYLLSPVSASSFGGMSGVVYGLFAFIWIRGRLDPTFRYQFPRQLVVFMLAWFALCFTGWVGSVANGAHLGGLAVGMVWGFVTSGYVRRKLL